MIKVKKTEIDKKEVTERRHENTLALTRAHALAHTRVIFKMK